MDVKIILEMIENCLKEKTITYNEFDTIFSLLSRKEQYEVTDILYKNGITLVPDEEEYPEVENAGVDQIAEEAEDIKALYDNGIFMDSKESEAEAGHLLVNHHIKQSNEILCSLIQEGNRQAKQDLCIKNRALVDKYAGMYGKAYGNNLDFEDLEQAGMMGLLKAAERFDMVKGYQFSTYATWWICQAITREIDDKGFTIRLPVHMMEGIAKIMSLDNRFASLGMDFNERIDAIQNETGISAEKILYYLMLRNNYLSNSSLNVPVGEDENIEIQDMVKDDENPSVEEIIEERDLHNHLFDLLNTLTAREKDILFLRFGLLDGQDRTLEQVGKIYNVTRERIRQIEAKALRKLRHPTRARKIRAYWE